MYWVDNGTGVTTPPTIPPVQSSARQYFTEGGQGQQPTIPGGEWFNMVNDELLSVLSAAGISPSKGEHTQLLLSIQKLLDRKTKYGCPLIGERIDWPHQLMPHEIFPDIGMHFIPYIGQPFDKSRFPLLAMIHPSGVLPADMRGEFPRGWDNGRGVDPGRVLMSAKGFTTSADGLRVNMQRSSGNVGSVIPPVNGGNNLLAFNANGASNLYSELVSGSAISSTATETASRSVAWNMITRTS